MKVHFVLLLVVLLSVLQEGKAHRGAAARRRRKKTCSSRTTACPEPEVQSSLLLKNCYGRAIYTCPEGFSFPNGAPRRVRRTCNGGGTWSDPPPRCYDSDGCEYPFESTGNGCYYYGCCARSWLHAREVCKRLGGYLASIESSQEQSGVGNWLNRKRVKVPSDAPRSQYWGVWIGGNDRDTEGTWKWVEDDSMVSWNKWQSAEPSNFNNKDCMLMAKFDQWSWSAEECTLDSRGFVCEMQSTSPGSVPVAPG